MIVTLNANALHIPLRDRCVQCAVTSPPYYALRNYGVDGQLGLESTPEKYVEKLVLVFREVWRVLRDDGVVWLNIGDSYAGSGGAGGDYNEGGLKAGQPRFEGTARQMRDAEARVGKHSTLAGGQRNQIEAARLPGRPATGVLKPKDLIGIPWMVAFALRADGAASPAHMQDVERMIQAITSSYETREQWPDRIAAEVERLEREHIDANRGGWYLRQEVIWHKPNCMPESAMDRPTRAHEQLFLLSKSRTYFYDAEAIKEESAYPEDNRKSRVDDEHKRIPDEIIAGVRPGSAIYPTRNKRSVWTIATVPYPEAHFATFPPDLVRPCILAGTSEKGCCPECGAPWERLTRKETVNASNAARAGNEDLDGKGHFTDQVRENHDVRNGPTTIVKTVGWQPTCNCHPAEGDAYIPIPCTVLDPFAGTFTTGEVAVEHRRDAVGLELNFKYIGFAQKRTAEVQPEMFLG